MAQALERNLAIPESEDVQAPSPDLQRRATAIKTKYREYCRITFEELGLASRTQNEQLKDWALNFDLKEEEIADREKWYEVDYAKKILSAKSLNEEFMIKIQHGSQYISKQSKSKWIQRFRNESTAYKEKEYWVKHQLPHYIERWKESSKEHEKLMNDPSFEDLLQYDPSFAILKKSRKDEFLDLHYDKRKGLLADARAAILAFRNMRLDLYAEAKSKLTNALDRDILGQGKVGIWLERIFKSKASDAKIAAFVRGSGANSLTDLMINWHQVKERYDNMARKVDGLSESEMPRGFSLVSPARFLNMHYAQRLQYMNECERRLGDVEDINKENPLIIKIRHAVDLKDWEDAQELIDAAWSTGDLTDKDRERVKSMQRYVTQFSSEKNATPLEKKTEDVTSAKKRIDQIVTELGKTHPEMQPTVLRLLRGPNGNRNIHQLRWIAYNNVWCHTRGYLNYERAKEGASDHNKKLMQERVSRGQDFGRHDVLDTETSGQQFLRKEEHANHKATVMHVNTKSGGALNTLERFIEKEQDPKVLYWTTFSANEDGEPKSFNWHNDFFYLMTELRGLTRKVNGAGFMYEGPNRAMTCRN